MIDHRTIDVERERFLLDDPDKYSIYGIVPDYSAVEVCLDATSIPSRTSICHAITAVERLKDSKLKGINRVETICDLPQDLSPYKNLFAYVHKDGKKYLWFRISVKELIYQRGKPQFYIEEEAVNQKAHTLSLKGWALADTPVSIRVYDEKKQIVEAAILRADRVDVTARYPECSPDERCGFWIQAENLTGGMAYLVMKDRRGNKSVYPIGLGKMQSAAAKTHKYAKKGTDYLRIHGPRALVNKTLNKFADWENRPITYEQWLKKHLPGKIELSRQRRTQPDYQPLISIILPVEETTLRTLEASMISLWKQTYENFEICLALSEKVDQECRNLLSAYEEDDDRIHIICRTGDGKSGRLLNDALALAQGEYISFLSPGDTLEPHALYSCVEFLGQNRDTDLLYTDEDIQNFAGNTYSDHYMKPEFSPDLLYATNYIGNMVLFRQEIMDKVGDFSDDLPGAEAYDYILRTIEATRAIRRLPKVLYHARPKIVSKDSKNSAGPSPEELRDASMRKALSAYYKRNNISAQVSPTRTPGLMRTTYRWEGTPLVSIIIPTKDHMEDLRLCIETIEKKTTYPNYEIIIIENNSTEAETFEYYKDLQAKDPKVRLVTWEREFNYSAINNFGISYAKGEYYILLNNDTELITPDWIEEMLGFCRRPDVGIVGVRMYYEDDTVQHAGVILGFGSIAGHAFVQQARSNPGYHDRIITPCNYSAVTAACLMVSREAYQAAGGLSEELAVAFNDIDFCMKVTHAGYLVVYDPYVELYHYESKSRGLEDSPEKLARFNREIATLESRWPDDFAKTDPYYSPNLTLDRQDFSLRRI